MKPIPEVPSSHFYARLSQTYAEYPNKLLQGCNLK